MKILKAYGIPDVSETWTVTKEISKKIDGCYSRMLRMALNIDWKARA